MGLQQIANPNRKLTLGFGIAAVIGLVVGIAGFLMEADTGIGIGIVGLIVALTGAISAPMLHSTGKKQVQEIEALLAGHDLRAHWRFDPDEWNRYTENEYARGMKQTRSVCLWTFAIISLLVLAVAWFSDAMHTVTILIALVSAALFTGLVAGSSYLMVKSAYSQNRSGVGEVYIGGTSVYLGTRFYTWQGKWAELQKVLFEPGDPSVVQFDIKYGSGDNTSHAEVRVPVPRGREGAAQDLVDSYYAAS